MSLDDVIKPRDMACEAIMELLSEGELFFESSDIDEGSDCSIQTSIRVADSMNLRGWLHRVEPNDRKIVWLPSERSLRAFREYDPEDEIPIIEEAVRMCRERRRKETVNLSGYIERNAERLS